MQPICKAVRFSENELNVIKNALFTQEKILTFQSRAGGNAAKIRLNELQGLMHRLRHHHGTDPAPRTGLWGQFARAVCNFAT